MTSLLKAPPLPNTTTGWGLLGCLDLRSKP
jgi:hypothetical protein